MSWTPPSRWRHDDGNTPSGNIKSIVAMATELTPLEPPDSHLLNAAEGWLELENWLEANEELELITPRNRAHPSIVRMRWLIYGKAKKWELAMEVGRLLSEMLPDNYFGFACYAYALHELKRTQEACAVLFAVKDKFPDEFEISYNLACYCCQLGDLQDSLRCIEKAMAVAGKKTIRLLALEDNDLKPLWEQIGTL